MPLSISVLESILRLDGAHIIGASYDSVERILTLGIESPDLRDVPDGWAIPVCEFVEKEQVTLVVSRSVAVPGSRED